MIYKISKGLIKRREATAISTAQANPNSTSKSAENSISTSMKSKGDENK
jgi:hypothetical protein